MIIFVLVVKTTSHNAVQLFSVVVVQLLLWLLLLFLFICFIFFGVLGVFNGVISSWLSCVGGWGIKILSLKRKAHHWLGHGISLRRVLVMFEFLSIFDIVLVVVVFSSLLVEFSNNRLWHDSLRFHGQKLLCFLLRHDVFAAGLFSKSGHAVFIGSVLTQHLITAHNDFLDIWSFHIGACRLCPVVLQVVAHRRNL